MSAYILQDNLTVVIFFFFFFFSNSELTLKYQWLIKQDKRPRRVGVKYGYQIITNTAHYSDVIMGAKASQITSLTIVYSDVYSDSDKKKIIKAPRHWPLCREFTAQMASNAENVSIWWRHHGRLGTVFIIVEDMCARSRSLRQVQLITSPHMKYWCSFIFIHLYLYSCIICDQFLLSMIPSFNEIWCHIELKLFYSLLPNPSIYVFI